MKKRSYLAACLVVCMAGCSSSTEAPAPTAADAGSTPTPRPPPPSGTDAPPPPGLAEPEVTRVMKMGGALHVVWRNQVTCDSIEGERRAQKSSGFVVDPYAVAFTVAGTADNQMDDAATADLTYTYRLRCKTGGAYSAYSNEMSENPVQ
jgi:hypothetical protein